MITLQVAYPDDNGILRYRLFTKGQSKKVSGNPLVEQLVTKVLLTDPGTDAADSTLGGGLRAVLTKNMRQVNPSVTQAEIGTAIIRTEEQIINSQSDLDLDPSEQLASIEIRKIEFSEDEGSWLIDLKLNMADGNVKRVLLEK